MKSRTAIFISMLAMAAAACKPDSNKEEVKTPEKTDFSITSDAGLPIADWMEGDAVDIFGEDNKACAFTVTSAKGKSATISGTILRADTYAFINPSSPKYNSYDGKVFTARLESSQEAIENASDPSCAIAVGTFTGKGNIIVSPLVSYIRVKGTFGGHDIESISFTSGDDYVAGTVRISTADGAATITRNGGFKTVVLKKSDGFLSENVNYVLALLPGIYKDAKLTVKDDSGDSQEVSLGNFTAKSGVVTQIADIKLSEDGWEGTEGPYKYATGVITWSDGTPAKGITVSDGFNTAVTDESGKYRVSTSSDTRYIYFSYPEDAKITVKNGCPEFFSKYDKMKKDYNFTLTRQSVENEFALFALADPQAHYEARSPQKKADTDRFRDESVPAINKSIAEQSLPCYGVTLGDIVYSEGSRNSNPGLTRMRDYFGLINMPVFQVMGNHDYTYFSSSNPLKTDEGSSDLNLKAQRSFEDTFGPVNYSFNRGNVHIVCMKNVQYDSSTEWSSYHCGYTNAQWKWLQADLANVPKTKAVIFCGHIPLLGDSSQEHVSDVLGLVAQYPGSRVFSGHTHYYRGVPNTNGSGLYEHIHSAVCGQWWWSNIEGDGCPNGYTVYQMKDRNIEDAFFIGVNDMMNTRDYQMRIYRGNLTSSNQDWWAIGYHIGVVGRGRTSTSYYTNMFHLWKYTLKNPSAKVKVVATDPYGNEYVCSDIVEDDSWYPSYIKAF